MDATPVVAIFDVGKTNKKILLIDEDYRVIWQAQASLPETLDDDGFPCEDIALLTRWLNTTFESLLARTDVEVKAVNFSGYGASFVLLNSRGEPFLPLYNYLKPFPEDLRRQFYAAYGGEDQFSSDTASPVLGNLNSGMQVLRLQHEHPDQFHAVHLALHLPQYLSYVICGKVVSEMTSIGCHTALWQFSRQQYHRWVFDKEIASKLPPILDGASVAGYRDGIPAGTGLHDSSAALVPYLASFKEPFILLSTGTWCISMNPFNGEPLTGDELKSDCLCYLTPKGRQVKASRLFAGHEHEIEVARLAAHFHKNPAYFNELSFDPDFTPASPVGATGATAGFALRDLASLATADVAYRQLIADIVVQQVKATRLVMQPAIRRLMVDGGFSKNDVFMRSLARAFPDINVYAAVVPQASAIGAAMIIHEHWNKKALNSAVIELTLYSNL